MQFRVLGPLEVVDDGELLKLAGSKQRSLLALLLLSPNEVVSRDVLIDGLWGERPPAGAVHSLEAHVSRLRKLLRENGDELVLTRPGGYVLQVGDGELDLERFERLADEGRAALRRGDEHRAVGLLRQALSLWRGQALEDIPVESSAVAEIRAIEDRRLAAFEDLVEAVLARDHQADVLPELERFVRANPLREKLQAQLMRALYQSGRQADALEAYRNARSHFVGELGIEPGPELRELEQAILRQDKALQPPIRRLPVAAGALSSKRMLVAAVALAVAAGLVIAGVFSFGGSSSLAAIPPDSVGAVDLDSGKIVSAVPVGSHPVGLAVAGGRLWVASLESRTISRIDPIDGKLVDVLSTGGSPTAIASGAGAVWVADGFAGKLVRLDPRTGRLTNSVTLGGHPSALAVDANGIWVGNSVLDAVQHVDPTTLEVREIRVGSEPDSLAVGRGSVWVSSSLGHTLTQIDSATATVLRLRVPLRAAPAALAFGDGSLWVTEPGAGAVARIDPQTGRAEATVRTGRSPTGVRVVSGKVWVADDAAQSLVEIDEEDNVVLRRVAVGAAPEALIPIQRRLWVATTRP